MGPQRRNSTILSSELLELAMRRPIPYILITLLFATSLFIWHRQSIDYKFAQESIHDYLRSQDIEDPQSLIHDRIFVSDNTIYQVTGYLYAKGESPVKYNFQHPPLVKYLFGFSTLLTGNPFYVQMIFGLALLFLTYFLGTKLFKNKWVAFAGTLLLLIDPVFQGLQSEALLDLGQSVFALGYVIMMLFYPESYILSGVILGLLAASKFWSTALVIVALVYLYKIFARREKVEVGKTILSFVVAFVIFCLSYSKEFIIAGGAFNIFAFLAKDAKFMFTHDSASSLGGPLSLFLTGYVKPWTLLWPMGLAASTYLAIRRFFFYQSFDWPSFAYALPFVYLLLISNQIPFTRYFILILPYIYLNLAGLLVMRK